MALSMTKEPERQFRGTLKGLIRSSAVERGKKSDNGGMELLAVKMTEFRI